MHFLIAEDDAVSRTLLQRAVERLGHTVVAAADGDQAWAAFESDVFDVVISDWIMPTIDGLELCRRIREASDEHYTYFILLTALDGRDNFVAGMMAGADDYLTKPLDREAMKARLIAADRIMSLHRKLADQNRQLGELNQRLYDEGRVDPLTRVGNRLRMTEELAQVHDRVQRYGHAYCVALCDIDYFKKYNDTCGHQAGDETLRAVAQCLAHENRAGDAVYRYGGEEFLVLLPEQTPSTAYIAMDRRRAAIEAMAIPHPGKTPPGVVTISAGVSWFKPGSGATVEEVLKEADDALYRAKEQGRNRVMAEIPVA